MSRIHIATRSTTDWRSRLGDPEKHWKPGASAMETAASWEAASSAASGLPQPLDAVFQVPALGEPSLLFAVAEHKVALAGAGGDSQCDVWALVMTTAGTVSMTVEAKAKEPFGTSHESLGNWLKAGTSDNSEANRLSRWENVRENLPESPTGGFDAVPFQILHRCAAAVIEARRFKLKHAVFVVQSFGAPDSSFEKYALFAAALGLPATKGHLEFTSAGEVSLGIGWVECPATSAAGQTAD